MTVLIVGGGIGGLALARALSISGNDDYFVLEQAPGITAVGAGIQITPNAARVIDYLELTEELTQRAVECEGTAYYDIRTDELLLNTPGGQFVHERYGFGYYQVHRAWLLEVLRRSIDPKRIRLGNRCVNVRQQGGTVFAEMENGEVVEGDVLIGADGINSLVRQTVFPFAGPAEFAGVVGCRSIIPAERVQGLDLDHRQHTWWGSGRRVIAYWVEGGAGLNFLAMVPCSSANPADWKTVADPANLRNLFAGSCSTITEMVEVIDETFATGVFGHEALERIVEGRIALLGDAAHPLPPYLANGAAQALEDAVVLAHTLTGTGQSVEVALSDYQDRRLPRVSEVQRGSWEMDALGSIGEPWRVHERNEVLREKMAVDPGGTWLRDWLWGYDAVAAATSPVVRLPERPDLDLDRQTI
jgi:salicylate hydroxylase